MPSWSHPPDCPLWERGERRAPNKPWLMKASKKAVEELASKPLSAQLTRVHAPLGCGAEEPSSARQKCPQICKTPSRHLRQSVLELPVACCPLQFRCWLSTRWRRPGCASCAPWVIAALRHSLQCPRDAVPAVPSSQHRFQASPGHPAWLAPL